MKWTQSQAANFQDAYLDWSTLLSSRRAALYPPLPQPGPGYQPIFVRLHAGDTEQSQVAARKSLKALVLDEDSPILMDGYELGFLQERIDAPSVLEGLPDEYTLYRRLGTGSNDYDTLFRVIDEGVPVYMATETPSVQVLPEISALPVRPKPTPIIAIVDDGIGFLNARFSKTDESGALKTRFHAVWLQALEERRAGSRTVIAGDVLQAADIDAMRAVPETTAYAELNADLFGPTARRATDKRESHGTHVLDCAAGAAPDDSENEVRDWPLLGVQLPPEALEDTSGTRLESYMVQAVRWCLHSAGKMDPEAPIIINLSVGIVAGPKDGTRFVEYQVAQEAMNWQAVTGQPVRVVWSFGNNYLSDLIAETKLDCDAVDMLTWRVQPGDQTASYMEIRLPYDPAQGGGETLEVALTTPAGVASGFAAIPAGAYRTLEDNGQPLARIYHVKARDYGGGVITPAHLTLALAPTDSRRTGEPLAPSGAWQVGLRNTHIEERTVTLQIQRDDSPGGNHSLARQSYFDGPDAHGWDDARQNYSRLTAVSPITYAGSHSALVTAKARQVLSVGAATRNDQAPATAFVPSIYTAEGAEWSVPGPTASTVADDGAFFWGTLASGTISGSTAVLTGTSVSAGILTRALGLSAARINANTGADDDLTAAHLEAAKVSVLPVPPEMQSRLGPWLVTPPDDLPGPR